MSDTRSDTSIRKPRSRRCQFSLRTLILLVAILGPFSASFGPPLYMALRELTAKELPSGPLPKIAPRLSVAGIYAPKLIMKDGSRIQLRSLYLQQPPSQPGYYIHPPTHRLRSIERGMKADEIEHRLRWYKSIQDLSIRPIGVQKARRISDGQGVQ